MSATTATFVARKTFAATVAEGVRLEFPAGVPVEVAPVTQTRRSRDRKTGEMRERTVTVDVAALCRQYAPTFLTEVVGGTPVPVVPAANRKVPSAVDVAALCRQYAPTFLTEVVGGTPVPVVPAANRKVPSAVDVAALCRQYAPTFLTEVVGGTPVPVVPAANRKVPSAVDVPPVDDEETPPEDDGLGSLPVVDLVELAEIREVESDEGPDRLSMADLKQALDKAGVEADRRSREAMLSALEDSGYDLNQSALVAALRAVGALASELTE